MLDFIKKHRMGIIGTVVVHFLFFSFVKTGTLKAPSYIKKNRVLIEFDFREEEPAIEEENKLEEELVKTEILSEDAINERIQNMMRDANDRRKKSNKNYSEQQIEQELEQKYKNLEQQIIQERQAAGKGFDPSKYEFTPSKTDANNNTSSGKESENQVSGRVATTCNIPGRKCFSKTPAYRCPTSGKVSISIKVNQKGQVTSARVNPSKSTTTNECLIQESLRYAKRTKANQDFTGNRIVDGTIEFNFIGQ